MRVQTSDSMSLPQPITAEPLSDAALIAAWRDGDERAAAALVERHARPLARFLAGAGALDADLDDVVQETFIRAFRSVDRFRGQCQFRTWLLTIGGNVLKDFGRRAARRRVLPLDEAVGDARGDPHEHAEASESEALLAAGLQKLPRLQREVFLLRAQHGMEYDDIAAALGTTSGAARVHSHHAVKRLREQPVRRIKWAQPTWLRVAAALVVVVGGGLVLRQLTPGPDSRVSQHAHLVADDLGDLSTDELRDVLSSFDQLVSSDSVAVPDSTTDLRQLDPQQLRAVLRSLEG